MSKVTSTQFCEILQDAGVGNIVNVNFQGVMPSSRDCTDPVYVVVGSFPGVGDFELRIKLDTDTQTTALRSKTRDDYYLLD